MEHKCYLQINYLKKLTQKHEPGIVCFQKAKISDTNQINISIYNSLQTGAKKFLQKNNFFF